MVSKNMLYDDYDVMISVYLIKNKKFLLNLCTHYANTPMQYTAIFHGCKNVNFQMILFKYFSNFLLKTLIVGIR